MSDSLRYLVVGTGGVGGSIAGFLALAGCRVDCIARGAHLEAIRSNGLRLRSTLKGDHYLQVPAFTAEEYSGTADVIFVCVKGYSLHSIPDLIRRASRSSTIVVPILNVYGTGRRLQKLVPEVNVLDGCIYIVGFISGPGEVTQSGSTFRIVFGPRRGQDADPALLSRLRDTLAGSGIKADLSDDIDRDTFVKWSFISAMALTGAYFDVPMGEVQKPGEIRDTFCGLMRESSEAGRRLGICLPPDMVGYGLGVIDHLDPSSTASMQKDLARGHESEIQGLLFDVIDLCRRMEISTPTYNRIVSKFRP